MSADSVRHLYRCGGCGRPGRPVELEADGLPVGKFVACSDCLERAHEHMGRVRAVFLAMLDAGVERELADETMTFLLERMPDPRKPPVTR